MDTIQKLIELFRQFPGIGPRQAKRFVYFLLSQKNGYTTDLSKLLSELKNDIAECSSCHRFFPLLRQGSAGQALCNICSDPKREASLLMIVSRDVDFENIEKTKSFTGYYFILGGTVPILDESPAERIRQKELLKLIESPSQGSGESRKEIIMALDANPEGEYTRDYITRLLGPLSIKYGFKISTLGRGLSTGSELEYSDPDTIKSALQSRK